MIKLAKFYSNDLVVLKIGSNKITSLDQISQLQGIKNLLKLDLSGNKVADRMDFEGKVFDLLPTLQVINDYDRDGEYVDDEFDHSEDFDLEEGEVEYDESDYEERTPRKIQTRAVAQ